MLLRGCFLAAKKVAVALDTLIRTRFPHDQLSVIGFAYYAREIPPGHAGRAVLARLRVRHEPAARAAARPPDPRPRARRQPRDRGHHRRRADGPFRGRPGRVQLPADAPDDPGDAARGQPLHARRHHHQHVHARAIAGPGRVRGPLTRLNRGRAFYATPERLGEYVLVDFVSRRTQHGFLDRAPQGRRRPAAPPASGERRPASAAASRTGPVLSSPPGFRPRGIRRDERDDAA